MSPIKVSSFWSACVRVLSATICSSSLGCSSRACARCASAARTLLKSCKCPNTANPLPSDGVLTVLKMQVFTSASLFASTSFALPAGNRRHNVGLSIITHETFCDDSTSNKPPPSVSTSPNAGPLMNFNNASSIVARASATESCEPSWIFLPKNLSVKYRRAFLYGAPRL